MSKTLAELLKMEGIKNPAVLTAIANTDRREFLPLDLQDLAELNRPVPIGHGQTISQPFIVARMTELLLGEKSHLNNVLEIGTGSGYQAAILAGFADKVVTIEHIKSLYEDATARLKQLHYDNVDVQFADGYLGWPAAAPYDGIIVTAAAKDIPPALIEQLALHGRLIIPVGESRAYQELILVTRNETGISRAVYDPVLFVPLLPGTTP